MQSVIWAVNFSGGGNPVMEIDEDGSETVFAGDFLEKKSEFERISLCDTVNSRTYSINLSNGMFEMGDEFSFDISKEIGGRVYPVSNMGLDYRSGVIQYKASKPVSVGIDTSVQIATYNIGYKVKLPPGFLRHRKGCTTVSFDSVQAILSINADTLVPCVSVSFLSRFEFPDGKHMMIKV